MKPTPELIGFVRYDELINHLNALVLTGGCDYRTLYNVAALYGLRDYLIEPVSPVPFAPFRAQLVEVEPPKRLP